LGAGNPAPFFSEANLSFKDLAQPLIERGVPVIPLRPRTKKAFSDDWPNLATTDQNQVLRWDAEFPNANIGCVGLAQEHGIWFFEIDDPDLYKRIEQETGQKFPDTIKVRSSVGRGHIYFRHTQSTRDLAYKKAYYSLKKPDGNGELCSARLNHAYVVGPGSIHPDTGQQYQIRQLAPIADAPEWLVDWIKKNLAQAENKIAVTAASDGPRIPRGSHDNELARIAGSLRAKGLTEEEMLPVLIRNVEERFDDYGSDYQDMCAKVAHSIGKKPAGTSAIQLTSGGKTAAELTQQAQGQPSALPVYENLPAVVDEPFPEFPEMSGALWDLAQEMYPDIPMSFKFMSLVTEWGIIRSGLDLIAGQRNFQTRFYTCLVAEPWRGKTAAMNESHNFLRSLYPPSLLYAESIDSGPALVDDFEDLRKAHPMADRLMVLLHADEMADLFEKAKSTAQSRNTLGGTWLSLYESNAASNRARNANKGRRIQIENAHFAILGGTTLDGYEMMWQKTGGGSNGLMSRFIPISTNAGRMPVNPRESSARAQNECLLKIKELSEKPPQTVYIEAEAELTLHEWWDKYRKIESASSIRVLDMVKRMLVVLTVTNPSDKDSRVDDLGDENIRYVSDELVKQACAFGDYVIEMRDRLNPMDSYTFVQSFENSIMRVFEQHPTRPFTEAQVISRVNVAKKPGGLGPFHQAWKNHLKADHLAVVGTTRKGTPLYQKKEAE
jgi:Bifunctional DNA primase/polymerase, N-terminal